MAFIDIARSRHSCRLFADSPLSENEKKLLTEAGRLAPSSRGLCPVRLIPVSDRETMKKLAVCKDHGGEPLLTSSFAVAVAADPSVADTWVEDASIASIMIQMEAEDLGLGSCWVQIRLRTLDGTSAEENAKRILGLDGGLSVLSVIAVGRKA